jgi:hypothetical protein
MTAMKKIFPLPKCSTLQLRILVGDGNIMLQDILKHQMGTSVVFWLLLGLIRSNLVLGCQAKLLTKWVRLPSGMSEVNECDKMFLAHRYSKTMPSTTVVLIEMIETLLIIQHHSKQIGGICGITFIYWIV